MIKKKRDISAEILQGIREIKRGEFGRVINVPDIAKTRKKTGCPRRVLLSCWGSRYGRCKIASKDAEHLLGPLAPFSSLPPKILKPCSRLPEMRVPRSPGSRNSPLQNKRPQKFSSLNADA